MAAVRFWTGLLGFTEVHRMAIPDEAAADLLSVDPPVGLEAVYLQLGGFTLELLHFDRPGNPAARRRVFNEPGLTHLSLSVDDPLATAPGRRSSGAPSSSSSSSPASCGTPTAR